MTDFDFNTSTPSNNAVPSNGTAPDDTRSGNVGYGGTSYGSAIPDGNPGNYRTPNPQSETEIFENPAAAATPSPKLGGKTIAIIAGLSLVCGLIGGVGGAFAMSAISGSGQQQTSQQGPGGQSNGQSNGQMGGPGGQSGSGSGQSNGQMGEPPSGQPGQGGSDSGQSGQGGSGQSGQSGSGQSGQQSGSGSSSSGSSNSSSYLDSEDSGSIAS